MNGNGTRTRSPNSSPVIVGVVGVVPDPGEGGLGEPRRGVREAPLLVAQAQEVDEVLDLGQPLGRERRQSFGFVSRDTVSPFQDDTKISAPLVGAVLAGPREGRRWDAWVDETGGRGVSFSGAAARRSRPRR